MSAGIKHPFTGALYERYESDASDSADGRARIRVTSGDSQGLFTHEGEWVSGELRECDPQLCGWVAGPQFTNHRMSEAAKRD